MLRKFIVPSCLPSPSTNIPLTVFAQQLRFFQWSGTSTANTNSAKPKETTASASSSQQRKETKQTPIVNSQNLSQQQQQRERVSSSFPPTSLNNETNNIPNNNNDKNSNANGPLHSVGVDPSQLGQPGSIRLEVQVTIMQGKMKSFEKKLDDNLLKLTKMIIESEVLTKSFHTNSKNDNGAKQEIEEKLQKLQESAVEVRKQISSSAAAWMSTALTMSSLLESEEGHREEMKIVLTDILDKLTTRSEFKALNTPKPPKQSTDKTEEEDEEFFKTHEDSIRVATLVRLARVEHDLGDFETALKHSQRAVDEILQQAKIIISNPSSKTSKSDNFYVYLLQNSTIRYEWLLLCTLHAVILAALNKTGAEQEFLKNVTVDCDKHISDWKIFVAGNSEEKKQEENNSSCSSSSSSSSNKMVINCISQEVVTFVELLMRYADSLGLEEGGGGWKKPQDPIFIQKRQVCEYLVDKFHPILGRDHPILFQARACLALDCGGVAVTRQETVSVMVNLINDAQEHLRQNQQTADQDEAEAKKTGFDDVLGTANEDLFALRAAILTWQRKLALAYADLKQFDLSLKLLSETSVAADDILGVSHPESIVALRCWMKVAWVSGDEAKAKELHGKLTAREKPAAI